MPNQNVRRERYQKVFDPEDVTAKSQEITELSKIDLGRSELYTDQQKVECVMYWLLTYNLNKTSYYSGIKLYTIKNWKYNSKWWKDVEIAIRNLKNEELERRLSDVIEMSVDKLFERLDKGDEVVSKSGDIVHKQVGARDLATIAAIFYDKRALLRGDPTQRVERSDNRDHLNKLAAQFQEIAKKQEQNQGFINAKPINVQTEESVSDANIVENEDGESKQ